MRQSVIKDNLLTWAERLDIAAEVLRRRQSVQDPIALTSIEIVEAVATEMRLASEIGHISTWPAPGGGGGFSGDERETEPRGLSSETEEETSERRRKPK